MNALMIAGTSAALDPELMHSSPWLKDVESQAIASVVMGIDPQTTLLIVAGVPVVMRLLKMTNEMTTAMIDDWKDGNRLKRDRERLEMQAEFERNKGAT